MSTTNGADGTNSDVDDKEVIATTGNEARRGSFGPSGGLGMPVERSDSFTTTVRRLGEILGKERSRLWVVLILTLLSVGLVAVGPRLLGQATDVIVTGV
ncbi:MAG: ABC transporter ATP-binding protein, partial [Actinomycetia bacterium]|nr:ABC transporter ATP-binding protein [Actinomycetes bacterium]